MNLRLNISLILLLMVYTSKAQLLPTLGGQRAGISTMNFLKSDISARSMALSGANLTLSSDGLSAFHNPAVMAQNEHMHFAISNLSLGAGAQQSWFSSVLPMRSSDAAFGLTINYFSSGAMEVRTEFQPQGTGELCYANQMAMGLVYARKLSDRFSFGANLKYLREQLAQYHNGTVAADLGFLYTTDVKDLKFGIVVKNFGGNSALNGDYIAIDFNRNGITLDKYAVPTVFRLGASMRPYKTHQQSLMVALQLEHPNDNSENIRVGLEYEYKEFFYLRGGFKINVLGEKFPTLGCGYRPKFKRHLLMVNYAVNATSYLGTWHCFGIDVGINNDKRE